MFLAIGELSTGVLIRELVWDYTNKCSDNREIYDVWCSILGTSLLVSITRDPDIDFYINSEF